MKHFSLFWLALLSVFLTPLAHADRANGRTSEATSSFLYSERMTPAERLTLFKNYFTKDTSRSLLLNRAAPSFRDTALASPPTYSLSAADAATTIANPQNFDAVVSAAPSPYFTWWGGTPAVAGVSYPNDGAIIAPSSSVPLALPTPLIEFMFHGRYLDLRHMGNSAVNQVYVDGQPLTEFTSTQSPSLTPPADGLFYRIILDFSTSTLRRIGYRTANKFLGVTVGPLDTIYPVSKSGVPRLVICGDSFTEGTGSTDPWTGYASLLGKALGCDTFISGSGGTGYLAVNAGLGRVKFRDRIAADVTALSPDIVIVAFGTNDLSNSAADIATEAALCYDDITEDNPNAALIVLSPFWPSGDHPATLTSLSPLLATAAAARGGVYVNLLSPKLVNGTGRVGTPVNDGNASTITSADGTHASQTGQEIITAAIYHQLATRNLN